MSKKGKKGKKGKRSGPAPVESRAYEAAQSTPGRRHVIGANLSQDAAAERAFPQLREWGRYLDENHDVAIGIFDELSKNIVGAGIVTIPKPLRPDGEVDAELADHLSKRWRRWTKAADVTGELSWNELQWLICRAWMRDGENFLQHVTTRYPFQSGDTPYRIESLESDMVPWDWNDPDRGWRQGIQHNQWRMPTNYAVYRRHPGDLGQFTSAAVTFDDLKVVDARNITHIKFTRRWPAIRGVSVMSGGIARLYDIKDLEESERLKNRVLASWCAAILKSPDVPGNEATDQAGNRFIQMASGTVIDTLAAGETITGVGPDYPTADMPAHIKDQHRRLAAGTGTRYSSIAKDYDGSYSSQRQEMVESEGGYKIRSDRFITKVCESVYERWLLADVTSGQTELPGGMDIEMASHAEYRGPVTPWIDQKNEVEADALAVESGFQTLEQIQIKRGMSPDMIGKPAPEPARPEPMQQLSLVGDEESA